jgi:hypothetical protein
MGDAQGKRPEEQQIVSPVSFAESIQVDRYEENATVRIMSPLTFIHGTQEYHIHEMIHQVSPRVKYPAICEVRINWAGEGMLVGATRSDAIQ